MKLWHKSGGKMMKKSLVFSAVAAVGLMALSTPAYAFDTTACMACHTMDTVKLGPSMKAVVAAYGNEKALAKVFESGFAVKDRKIASADPQWTKKTTVMTLKYMQLIKGHEKEAAHALFETVKNGKFGNY